MAPDEAERFDRAFARAAGAALTSRNVVRLLLDARENFPAWLAAIAAAQRYILFESYIVADDRIGRAFTEALAEKARAGVLVYVVYDWLGSTKFARTWDALRAAGAEVRCFNPPSLDSPFAWLTRDHRKSIVVDGEVGFVSGLCISEKWEGNPKARLEPWRDTGVELRGESVLDLVAAFDQVWTTCGGAPLTFDHASLPEVDGATRVRVIAGVPSGAGMYRTDLLVASTARRTLWITDAYFVATAAYTQALRAAARDGVDVRLLVPGASDIPAVSPLSRSGYRSLLEAGVRVFEWNGTMLHAKSAVADGIWSRVGSTNLNLASWLSNYELDVAIEDTAFAHVMAWQYEQDLARATEIVLTRRNRVRRTEAPAPPEADHGARRAMSGSAGRAAAGAVSVSSALGAALTNRRTLGPAEAGLLTTMAVVFVAVAVLAAWFPFVIAWPIAVLAAWMGVAWGVRGWRLWRQAPPAPASAETPKSSPVPAQTLEPQASSERKG
ncbi:MAG: phospholipase D-like domain-containing protein [Burkholderiales bacterium]